MYFVDGFPKSILHYHFVIHVFVSLSSRLIMKLTKFLADSDTALIKRH